MVWAIPDHSADATRDVPASGSIWTGVASPGAWESVNLSSDMDDGRPPVTLGFPCYKEYFMAEKQSDEVCTLGSRVDGFIGVVPS